MKLILLTFNELEYVLNKDAEPCETVSEFLKHYSVTFNDDDNDQAIFIQGKWYTYVIREGESIVISINDKLCDPLEIWEINVLTQED